MTSSGTYLFSIDLEDVRDFMADGDRYRERVPVMTERYLTFLREWKLRCTFFVVGDVARKYPELIQQIVKDGHEIACHSNKHITLENLNERSFQDDLEKNISHLQNAGAQTIKGFRAPILSLTDQTQWAYGVLAKLGFTYSSSVLPARNPLYGWPEFGHSPRSIDGILELPMTLSSGLYPLPFAGGTYFRALPLWYTLGAFKRHHRCGHAVLGYFHPYDIDTEQEHFMHPGIHNNRFFNFLMYYNRRSVFPKLESILKRGWNIIPYVDFIQQHYH